ncbi:MAG: FKBP-type peptidyl-prolyl cis-trans isomerase [Opitutales bacterium]|jgi:FKBP-type peptidyl-prolyl cis-trans isomerase
MKLSLKTSRAGIKTAGLLFVTALFVAPTHAQKGGSGPDAEVFEAIGMMFAQGSGLNRMDFSETEIQLILSGIRKGLALQELPPAVRQLEPKVQSIMQAKMATLRKAQQAEGSKLAVANKLKGQQFLAALAKKPGVKKDPSGFYYEILKEGKGPFPTMANTVRLHYHGTLIDGTVFDSSVQRGEPTSFQMGGVIKGFSGGLSKTKVGGKVRIYIPSDLAYGDNPRPGGKIKPGDTLIFECELLEIVN